MLIVFLGEIFLKNYHQQGAQLSNPNQNIEFISGENNNYHQTGNAYLDFDVTVRNPAGNFIDASNIGLIKSGFAYCFKEAFLSTTGGYELEYIKYLFQVSTIKRLLTSKDADLYSCFGKNCENSLNDNNVLKKIMIKNHATKNQ